MSDLTQRIQQLSPKRLALVALELEERLEAIERDRQESIAIVGMACRFPGNATTPEAYWQLLREGVDAITEVPADRWDVDALYDPNPDAPGRMSTRWAGFVDGWDQFDPKFFGISPREAHSMDPQQRAFLEVAWEAMERAGQSPQGLHGSSTGVFVGVCNSDYAQLLLRRDLAAIDAYFASGSAFSVLAGRLSYLLGLQGPAISVDTACSSSLVAVHQAVQSLRARECRMAVAGGVNYIGAPQVTIALSKAKMMAPDGRCKTFDNAADGFVRGEGCGVVLLKRLSDARQDGDPIVALIRGSACNQDGRSSGLTVPNGPSQEAVIRAALANGGVEPAEIDYVEAHGTGTSLGDPIEVRALGNALGAGRSADAPLLIGSVKTNIGHLESAAGIAGLIKAALSLRHEELPRQLHFRTPNSHIAWHELPLSVVTEPRPWKRGPRKRLAGVSSFGFSGTNAHIVLEEAPAIVPAVVEAERPLHILTISARSAEELRRLAAAYADRLVSAADAELPDICFTANTGRSHFGARLAVRASTPAVMSSALRQWLENGKSAEVVTGTVEGEAPEVAFLFTGQGSQYPGMAKQLYATQPDFREALDRCDAILRPLLPAPLLSVIFEDEPSGRLNDTAFTQPALVAIEYALAHLWQTWGVRPGAVMGHSIGEITAAIVSGVMVLEDGLRFAAVRGRLMSALPSGGRMTAVFASPERVESAVAPYGGLVSVAAYNGPDNVVISGAGDALDAIAGALSADGIKMQGLTTSHAFHSPLMAPMIEAFRREIGSMTFAPPRIAYVSNLTGRLLAAGTAPDVEDWCRHVMQPVKFATSVEALAAAGYRTFLEIGPNTTLLGMARRVAADEGFAWIPSLRKQKDDWPQLLAAVGSLYANGVRIDWSAFDRAFPRRRVLLPTYPFSRQRYWAVPTEEQTATARRARSTVHPLLGTRLRTAVPTFESGFDPARQPILRDHRVQNALVVPGPVYLEMGLAAAGQALGDSPFVVKDLRIREPLVLSEGTSTTVQTVAQTAGPDALTIAVFSANGEDWAQHSSMVVSKAAAEDARSVPALAPLDEVRERCAERIEATAFYAGLAEQGIEVGGAVRPIQTVYQGPGEALAVLSFDDEVVGRSGYHLHPSILDAAMLAIGAAARHIAAAEPNRLHVLTRIERTMQLAPIPAHVLSHVRIEQSAPGAAVVASLYLRAEDGSVVAVLEGIQLSRVDASLVRTAAATGVDPLIYDVEWREVGSVGEPAAMEVSAAEIASGLGPRAVAVAAEHGLGAFDAFLTRLDRACGAYVLRAFRSLGFAFKPGHTGNVSALAGDLGILPRHLRLFDNLLEMLAADGVLRLTDGGWEVVAAPDAVEPDDLCAALLEDYPGFGGQVRITTAAARELAGVLRGDVDPLHLLFPNGSFELTEALYQHGPFAQAYNTLAQDAIAEIVKRLPHDRRIRCLEVGAGTGGTSAFVLQALPAARSEYVYTDLSKLFLTRAAAKFREFPFLRFEMLDIERDPLGQGFRHGSFDVVIASNVVHATTDVKKTLTHVRQLLAPGGLLLLLEGTEQQRWVDLTFGLLEGWWKFTDAEVRPDYPLLNRGGWAALLRSSGYDEVHAVPSTDGPQALIVARASASAGAADTGPAPRREWVIVGSASGVAGELATLLRLQGASAKLVADDANADALRGALAWATGDVDVVYAASSEDVSPDWSDGSALVERLARISSVVASLAALKDASAVRLWLVTSGAQAVGEEIADERALQAGVWGYGRVIALEHPEIWGGVIDLDPAGDQQSNASMLIEAMAGAGLEDQLAIRRGVVRAPRLVRSAMEAAEPVSLRSDAAYLVTGGTGGIAVPLVPWLVDRGARHLVLVSRRGLPDREAWPALTDDAARRLVQSIRRAEAAGAVVEVVACDVTDRAALSSLVESFGRSRPALRGVIHAAVTMTAASTRDADRATLGAMIAAKVDGVRALQTLTAGLDLDFDVMFSSTTALWGVAGLGHYAAANQVLDALARARPASNRLAVNWGTWAEMRLASESDRRGFVQSGLNPMPSDEALARMGRLIAGRVRQKTVADVEWSVLKAVYEARRPKPFFNEVGPLAASTGAGSVVPAAESVASRLKAAAPSERHELLIAYLREQVADVLGVPSADAVSVTQGLFEMGMDSLMSVELKNRLESGIQQPLPSTLTFNYPNIGALATFLSQEVLALDGGMAPEATSEPEPPAAEAEEARDDMSEDELADLLASRLGRLR